MRAHVHAGCLSGDATIMERANVGDRTDLGILLPGLSTPCVMLDLGRHKLGGLVLWVPEEDHQAVDRIKRALVGALDCLPGAWIPDNGANPR